MQEELQLFTEDTDKIKSNSEPIHQRTQAFALIMECSEQTLLNPSQILEHLREERETAMHFIKETYLQANSILRNRQ